MSLTESQEVDIFNGLFQHCELIDQIGKEDSYMTKYQLCEGYTQFLNNSNRSKTNFLLNLFALSWFFVSFLNKI